MTKPTPIDQPAIAAAIDVLNEDGEPKREFRIMPFGNPIPARDGRIFRLRDQDHANRVLSATASTLGSAQMMADYDHQSYFATGEKGGRAAAAGWVGDLEVRDDGIWATDVEWTKPALAQLQAREYRYISPYFRHDPKSGDVTRIVNIGLTNTPNFDLPAVAAQQEGSSMNVLAKIAKALGLGEDATEEEVLGMIEDWKTAKATAGEQLKPIILALGLEEGADVAAIEQAATAAVASAKDAPSIKDFVPRADFDLLKQRLDDRDQADAVAMVDQAVEDGKIAPAQKDYWLGQAKKDRAAVASYLDTAPVFDGGGEKVTGKKPDGSVVALTEAEAAACEMTGTSHEDFLAQKNEEPA